MCLLNALHANNAWNRTDQEVKEVQYSLTNPNLANPKFLFIQTGCKKNSHKKKLYLFRRKLTEYYNLHIYKLSFFA
jgi:hypothetical protein